MNEVTTRPPAPALPLQQDNSEAAKLTRAIIAAAKNPEIQMDKMERLLDLHERITAKEAEQQFNTAMVGAQSQMGRIAADAVNPQTRSQYASYAQLDRYLRPLYTASGFSLSFDEGEGAAEGFVRVVCYVAHIGGHTRTYHCDIPADGKGAKGGDVMTRTHAVGSGKSYGKRYLLKDIFNVAVGEDDDDGNAAGYTDTRTSEAQIAFDGYMQRISGCSDSEAAGLWQEGSVVLANFKRRDLYERLKTAIIGHRKGLQ
ncbi:ERF family protein [Comamonas sp. MYb396]|uniref:ERF family protein n=1 Tax=Comamonas sp. MYb396 TaxID=2745302 RepID=UPI00309644F3